MKTRRTFIKKFTVGAGSYVFASGIFSITSCNNKGEAYENKKVSAEPEDSKKLGMALVGLGSYSEGQLGPALKKTKYCKLSGIVTGTPGKINRWKEEYNIPDNNVYTYDTFEKIKDNKDIDIVYVVLPNALHAEYVIKAAKAGKHVICEKPMGISSAECEQMIQACKEANKMLSVGYRLHFEPFHKELARIGQQEVLGKIKSIKSSNGFLISDNPWRIQKALSGGGPLMDMGIYCLQAALYTMGKNPIAVTAKAGENKDPQRFKDVEQSITFNLEFPDGIIAECSTTYADYTDMFRADAEKGWVELLPAFDYSRKKGKTNQGPMNFPDEFEQVYQMDDFAQCILHNKPTIVPGEMGLRDLKIIEAIYQSAATGKRVELSL